METIAEDAGEDTRVGAVTWHCSEEDGLPDVGISVFLGSDERLWCGELPSSSFGEYGGWDHFDSDGGWFIVHYRKSSASIIAKCGDPDEARGFLERTASWLAELTRLRQELEDEKSARLAAENTNAWTIRARTAEAKIDGLHQERDELVEALSIWHPIGSAPDGPKHVLYGYIEPDGVLRWAVSGFCGSKGRLMNDALQADAFPNQPTHWAELPKKQNGPIVAALSRIRESGTTEK